MPSGGVRCYRGGCHGSKVRSSAGAVPRWADRGSDRPRGARLGRQCAAGTGASQHRVPGDRRDRAARDDHRTPAAPAAAELLVRRACLQLFRRRSHLRRRSPRVRYDAVRRPPGGGTRTRTTARRHGDRGVLRSRRSAAECARPQPTGVRWVRVPRRGDRLRCASARGGASPCEIAWQFSLHPSQVAERGI